ncbi:unnamed protein product, partial [Ceratitis capitata]
VKQEQSNINALHGGNGIPSWGDLKYKQFWSNSKGTGCTLCLIRLDIFESSEEGHTLIIEKCRLFGIEKSEITTTIGSSVIQLKIDDITLNLKFYEVHEDKIGFEAILGN